MYVPEWHFIKTQRGVSTFVLYSYEKRRLRVVICQCGLSQYYASEWAGSVLCATMGGVSIMCQNGRSQNYVSEWAGSVLCVRVGEVSIMCQSERIQYYVSEWAGSVLCVTWLRYLYVVNFQFYGL